ncbi:FecR family protein [Ochrobactrum sp. GRS2]|nr:FecR family protein [Ochrobactrum sp. GRS2]
MGQDIRPDSLLDEAIDWLLRLQSAAQDPALSKQFILWLQQSDAHKQAWEKAQHVWGLMGQTEPVHESLWSEQNAAPVHVPSQYIQPKIKMSAWRKVQAGILSIAAVIALYFATPSLFLRFESDHRTTTAQTETITLSDGSTIMLAAESAIAVDMSQTVRQVRLLRGEAYFDVVKDTARPFLVSAGEAEVSVLGTAFDVKLTGRGTNVALERGSVEVRDRASPEQQTVRLIPGEQVELQEQSEQFIRTAISTDKIAGWRKGYLFVEDATISSVIEELQRYHPAWITMMGSSLGDERVTGLYNLNEPDRALRALVQPYGGTVRSVSPYLRVLSRK